MNKQSLMRVFNKLAKHYGQQDWWPADTPFEVMIGAILTQNTSWTNVEKAISQLRRVHCLSAASIDKKPVVELAQLIQPSGYYNIKAKRLKAYCHWYRQAGGFDALQQLATADLRTQLLCVHGVGPETADDILLYAFHRPVFVIDAYTRRLFSRLGWISGDEGYDELRLELEKRLGEDRALFNEYHALLVMHGKETCRSRPRCSQCLLTRMCKTIE